MFRYIQERLSRRGSIEQLSEDFALSEILVGRGGKSHIILTSREVSLEHAAFKFSQGVLSVSDLNSFSGIQINGGKTQGGLLNSGDTVRIGDIHFRVEISGEVISLIQLRSEVAEMSPTQSAQKVVETLARLRIDTYLPSMRMLSYGGLALVLGLFFLWPLSTRGLLSWNSGPVSNSHKLISADCSSCHTFPFAHVRDAACESCHSMSKHTEGMAQLTAQHPEMTFRCGQCHMEHNGDSGVISQDGRFCTGCHSDIGSFKDHSQVKNVAGFDSHPQFRISVVEPSGQKARVDVDDQARAKDSTPIKLNHAIHLKPGLRGAKGPVTLECSSCHQLDRDLRIFEPITFEKNCADCHTLGFDERLPNTQVPHAAPDDVYAALFTQYTKLLLLETGPRTVQVPSDREMPKGTRGVPVDALKVVDTTLVEQSARDAERQLFTKTACMECHEVAEKPRSEWIKAESRYRVTPVQIPTVWYSGARFSHGAHEPFTCESCHKDVRASKHTSDLLLPHISNCQGCHVGHDKPGFVKSECTLCHSYHASESVPSTDKRDIAEYLHGLVR